MVVAGEVGDHPKELQLSAGTRQIIDNARVHGNLTPTGVGCLYHVYWNSNRVIFWKRGSGLSRC